jgi:hypothetical protein
LVSVGIIIDDDNNIASSHHMTILDFGVVLDCFRDTTDFPIAEAVSSPPSAGEAFAAVGV